MKYYYDPECFKSFMKLKELKDLVSIKAQPLADKISQALFKEIKFYWTRRDTLGFVFTDFDYQTGKSFGSTHKKLIGKGEKDLFKNIRDDYVCLVMSRTQDKNFREFNIGNEKGLVVNIDYFKEFLNIIRNSKNTVRFFLYRFETKQQEELIRGWLRNYGKFEEISKEARIEDIDAMIDVINKQKIDKATDLDRLITLARATGKHIQSNYQYFEKKLSEFKSKIDGNADEIQVRAFMFENIWLLDFQYMNYKKKKEEEVSTGGIDISLLKDELGISQAVVVELKKPSAPVVTEKYRGIEKPAILAEVGKAISQTIHYLEPKKNSYRTLRGLVIIGRKTGIKDEFLQTFNTYLHGIEVLTYDDLYKKAKDVIDVFKSNQEKPSTAIVPVPPSP
jgi:ribosomal protein L19